MSQTDEISGLMNFEGKVYQGRKQVKSLSKPMK